MKQGGRGELGEPALRLAQGRGPPSRGHRDGRPGPAERGHRVQRAARATRRSDPASRTSSWTPGAVTAPPIGPRRVRSAGRAAAPPRRGQPGDAWRRSPRPPCAAARWPAGSCRSTRPGGDLDQLHAPVRHDRLLTPQHAPADQQVVGALGVAPGAPVAAEHRASPTASSGERQQREHRPARAAGEHARAAPPAADGQQPQPHHQQQPCASSAALGGSPVHTGSAPALPAVPALPVSMAPAYVRETVSMTSHDGDHGRNRRRRGEHRHGAQHRPAAPVHARGAAPAGSSSTASASSTPSRSSAICTAARRSSSRRATTARSSCWPTATTGCPPSRTSWGRPRRRADARHGGPARAVWTRTLLAELNRVLNHLMFLGSYPLELGGITPVFYAFREREELQNVMEEISGGRMHYMFNRVGGLKEDLPAGWATPRACRGRRACARAWTCTTTWSSATRSSGAARAAWASCPPEAVHAYGVSGPIARASGVDFDLRRDEPYLGVRGAPGHPEGRHPDARATAWPASRSSWSRPTTPWTSPTPAWTGSPSCRPAPSTSGSPRSSRRPRATRTRGPRTRSASTATTWSARARRPRTG